MASSVSDYAKDKAKKVATHFLTKLIDSFDSDKDESSTNGNSGTPPSYSSNSGRPPAPPSPGPYRPDLASSFNAMSISNNQPPPPPDPGFIGGFHPQYINDPSGPYSSQSAAFAQSTPHPYTAASSAPGLNPYTNPQSNTMQMALQSDNAQPPWKSDTAIPNSHTTPHKPTQTTPSKPQKHKPSEEPEAPTPSKPKPSRPSTTKSSSGKGRQVQCAGVTKAGKQCTRMVKVDGDSGDESDSDDHKFCHQHSKEVLTGNSGFYARKNGEWVKFDDWIPPYLQPEAQVALRCEMERSRSQSDVPGYIYTFEIRDETEKSTIKLKVGRAVNLVKRIDQWGKQCGSKEQVLRGFYPGTVDPDEDGGPATLMKGRVHAGEKGQWCHRLERLIHIELGDLVRTSIYLDPSGPKFSSKIGKNETQTVSKRRQFMPPCSDCGSMHKEIFEFERWKTGKNKGKEWDTLVRGVIERWGRFVESYL